MAVLVMYIFVLSDQSEKYYRQEQEAEKEPYVPRTRGIRILAWTLFALILIGVALYYFWIAKAGTL